jgi:hypothetical protein
MSDIDSLTFDIRFALKHKTVGASVRKLVRSLPEAESPEDDRTRSWCPPERTEHRLGDHTD